MDIIPIYGQSPTPNETPFLIKDKLAQFALALDNKIDKEKLGGYLLAKDACPEECDDTFKLVFLRCEVFDVKRAVERWLKYWDARIKVFGKERAFLPMTLDGAMKDDRAAVQLNYMQVATETDPDGRAILLFDHRKDACDISSEGLLRAVWYQTHIALSRESAQRRGVVVYWRCLDNLSDWRFSLSKKIALAGKGILPVRFAGMHFISPPVYLNAALSLIRPLLGKKLRHRFYMHSGSVDEILSSLSMFGLGTKDRLPVIFGGHLMFE